MRTLLFLLLTLASASAQFKIGSPFYSAALQAPASAGPTYVLQENFDGTGYQNTWVEVGSGTINEDYATSPAPLEGTQSLYISASVQNPRTTNVLAVTYDSLYGYAQVHWTTIPSSTGIKWLAFQCAGTNVFSVESRGTTNGVMMRAANTAIFTTTGIMPQDSTFYIWWGYTKGTGNNASAYFAYSGDTTKPSAGASNYISTATGNASGAVEVCLLGLQANATMTLIYDKLRLSATDIGNDPP